MVYYFTSNIVDPPATIYVGKDKFENEELIKFGWDCDVWVRLSPNTLSSQNPPPQTEQKNTTQKGKPNADTYHHLQFHADNLSSAHIYLRLAPDQKWDQLPTNLIEECARLTKANSIEGRFSSPPFLPQLSSDNCNKKDNVTIIYTPWSNLYKNAGMATGQVGFHDNKKTKKTLVPTRHNPTINRLEKTRTIRPADELPAAKETYLSSQRAEKRREAERKKKEEEKVMKERREEKERKERGYDDFMEGGGERSNEVGWDEEDFM